MKIELNYSQKKPVAQLLHFFLVFGFCLFLAIFANLCIFKIASFTNVLEDSINLFKVCQVVSQVIIFLLPALVFGYYYSENKLSYNLYLNPFSKTMGWWLLILFLAIWPLIDLSSFLNYKILASWKNFDAYLQNQDAQQNVVIKKILTFRNPFDFIFSIIVTGLVPAISEELFFRSIINKIVYKITKKIWPSILLTGLIFAILHFHFYGLLPRMLMGMLFSFLLFYTNSVYPSMIMHFFYNSVQVVAAYIMGEKYIEQALESNALTFPLYLSVIASFVFIAVIYFLLKRKNNLANGI